MDIRKLAFVPLGVLILVLGGLVAGVILGDIEQSTASTVSSFTLVVVTAVYAYQTVKSVEYTEESLDEMRRDREKPGSILVIAYGIDPLLDEFERRQKKWREEARKDSFSSIQDLKMPDNVFLNDLDTKSPGIKEMFSEYVTQNRRYMIQWGNLVEMMEEAILEEREDLLQSYVDNDVREEEILESYAHVFARNIMELSSGRRGHSEIWADLNSELLELREKKIKETDEIDELMDRFEQVKSLNHELIYSLRSVREEYKSEYGITDLEVLEAKEESSLEQPDVVMDDLFV
ncbi:hypothetical protein [Halohasta litorea]|uniref:Uncharacterized protein n=1 Tax=Halohasta litorea TaxID=869891 RepID=A0ABD6DCZ1_9EURY|nr:hypothetical protein [Halohasta litorea]